MLQRELCFFIIQIILETFLMKIIKRVNSFSSFLRTKFYQPFCFFITSLHRNLLAHVNPKTNPVVFATKKNPKTVTTKVTEADVVAVLRKVSTVLNTVDKTLKLSNFFFDLRFLSLR